MPIVPRATLVHWQVASLHSTAVLRYLVAFTDGAADITSVWPRLCVSAGWAFGLFGIATTGDWLLLGCAWGPALLREEDGSFGGRQPSAFAAEVHAMVALLTGLRKVACGQCLVVGYTCSTETE